MFVFQFDYKTFEHGIYYTYIDKKNINESNAFELKDVI
jgi:hypothetical protein